MPFGQPLIHKVTLDSTNTFLKHLAAKGVPEGTLVWADSQTGGRGRYGREWHSPKGNLYASLLLKPLQRSNESIPQISLLAGIAVAETLEKVFHRNSSLPQIGLKWPNDIYLNRKKCGGLLCEIEPLDGDEPVVIAGLGLNVNGGTFPSHLSGATSLSAETGKEFDISNLLLEWCAIFQELYEMWQRERFASWQKRWERWDILMRERVSVNFDHSITSGIACGIDSTGALLIEEEDGSIKSIRSGTLISAVSP